MFRAVHVCLKKPVNIYSPPFNGFQDTIIHCYHSCISNCLVVTFDCVRLLLRIFLHMLFRVESSSAYDLLYPSCCGSSLSQTLHIWVLYGASLISENTAMQYYTKVEGNTKDSGRVLESRYNICKYRMSSKNVYTKLQL